MSLLRSLGRHRVGLIALLSVTLLALAPAVAVAEGLGEVVAGAEQSGGGVTEGAEETAGSGDAGSAATADEGSAASAQDAVEETAATVTEATEETTTAASEAIEDPAGEASETTAGPGSEAIDDTTVGVQETVGATASEDVAGDASSTVHQQVTGPSSPVVESVADQPQGVVEGAAGAADRTASEVTAGASEDAAAANTAATVVAAGSPGPESVGPEAGAMGSAVEAVSETTTVVDGVSSVTQSTSSPLAPSVTGRRAGRGARPNVASGTARVVSGTAGGTRLERDRVKGSDARTAARPAVLGRNAASSRVSPAQAAPPFFPSPDAAELMTAVVADEEFVTQSEETERAPEAGPSGQGWSPGWLPFTGFVLTWFVAVAFVLVTAGATVDRCGSPIAVE